MPIARQQTMFSRAPLPDIDRDDFDIDDAMDATDDLRGNMKFTVMIAGIKQKLSCCFGGKEEKKSGILGKFPGM